MAAGTVEMELVQGEDWTVDVIWTDNFDVAMNVVHPCRFTVKGSDGSTLLTLLTDPNIPDGEIPGINLSNDIGLLQLHVDDAQTATFPPGQYSFELKVTSTDGGYAGPQKTSLLSGPFTVSKSITG